MNKALIRSHLLANMSNNANSICAGQGGALSVAARPRRLGRHSDPRTPADLSRASLWCRKLGWRLLTTPGLRAWTRWLYPTSTISHLDVDGAVAFTVDDGFCGLDNPAGCMLDEEVARPLT